MPTHVQSERIVRSSIEWIPVLKVGRTGYESLVFDNALKPSIVQGSAIDTQGFERFGTYSSVGPLTERGEKISSGTLRWIYIPRAPHYPPAAISIGHSSPQPAINRSDK